MADIATLTGGIGVAALFCRTFHRPLVADPATIAALTHLTGPHRFKAGPTPGTYSLLAMAHDMDIAICTWKDQPSLIQIALFKMKTDFVIDEIIKTQDVMMLLNPDRVGLLRSITTETVGHNLTHMTDCEVLGLCLRTLADTVCMRGRESVPPALLTLIKL